MFRNCRQFGTRFSVALLTVGLAVAQPVLARPICHCAEPGTAQEERLTCCGAERGVVTGCDEPQVRLAFPSCCTGGVPCQCPGCRCSLRVPDALDTSVAASLSDSSKHRSFPPAIRASLLPSWAEPISQAAIASEARLRRPTAELQALYCVWII